MQMEMTGWSIAEAGRRLRAKEVSPGEITEAYLRRIERLNPRINAYVTVTSERAQQDARAAGGRIASGETGPLLGIPIGLKDLYATKGIRTAAGAKILADWVPDHDCTVARKLAEAGC